MSRRSNGRFNHSGVFMHVDIIWLIVGTAVAGALALAGFISTLVLLIQCKWRHMLVSLFGMLLCTGLCAGLVFALLVRGTRWAMQEAKTAATAAMTHVEAEQQAREEAKQARIQEVEDRTPAAMRGKIDSQFWNFEGFRDWYRIPVRYPYSIQCIDSLEKGAINENLAGGKCDDPNKQERQTGVSGITFYSADANMLIYRKDVREKVIWGIFTFDSGTNHEYASQEEMLRVAKERGFSGKLEMRTIQEQHNDYWGR